METLAERITASFYAWEVRGRGWQLADYPVALEPPFRRCFLLPGLESSSLPFDDGRRPTFLSRLADRARGLRSSPSVASATPAEIFGYPDFSVGRPH